MCKVNTNALDTHTYAPMHAARDRESKLLIWNSSNHGGIVFICTRHSPCL